VIGDGEAETGAGHQLAFQQIPDRSRWPVIPILHLNGYKIAGPTSARIPAELDDLLKGYGIKPYTVEGDEPWPCKANGGRARNVVGKCANPAQARKITTGAPAMAMIVLRSLKDGRVRSSGRLKSKAPSGAPGTGADFDSKRRQFRSSKTG